MAQKSEPNHQVKSGFFQVPDIHQASMIGGTFSEHQFFAVE
jgi:hypothetical protein